MKPLPSDSPINAHCDDEMLWGRSADGRRFGVPLAWFAQLLDASPEDRVRVNVITFGLQWAALDADSLLTALVLKCINASGGSKRSNLSFAGI